MLEFVRYTNFVIIIIIIIGREDISPISKLHYPNSMPLITTDSLLKQVDEEDPRENRLSWIRLKNAAVQW